MSGPVEQSELHGPDALAGSVRSLAGPFARSRSTLTLPPLPFAITNAGNDLCTLTRIACDPLRDAAHGSPTDGSLAATPIDSAAAALEPGDSLALAVTGRVPSRPGTYASTVRVMTGRGHTLAVPLTISVAAHPAWGLLMLLLGLAAIGLLNVLSGASDNDRKLRDILAFREAVQVQVEAAPPPLSQQPELARLDRDADAAIASLRAPRGLSVSDPRIADADEHLALARDRWSRLRATIGNGPPGTAEVAELQAAWESFKTVAAQQEPPPPPVGGVFGTKLVGFVDRLRAALFSGPAQAVLADLAPQVERAELLMAAGQHEPARQSAIAVHRAIMQAATFIEARLAAVEQYDLLVGGTLNSDLAARAQAATLPDPNRDQILAALNAAESLLGDGATLANLRDANSGIEHARTAALGLARDDLVVRARGAVAQSRGALSTEAVDRAMEAARAWPSAEQKRAGVRQVVQFWHSMIAAVPDSSDREALTGKAAALADAAAAVDLSGVEPAYIALQGAWTAYSQRRQIAALRAVTLPFCRAQRDVVLQDLGVLAAGLGAMRARPELPGWEQELDRIRLSALQLVLDEGAPDVCLGRVASLSGDSAALSASIYEVVLKNSPIPQDAKLDAARRSGDAAAVTLVESLTREPRALSIEAATPEGERYAGRVIAFRLGGLDPAWGASVDMSLDFGDGTQLFHANADAVRRGAVIEHVYAAPVTALVHATATAGAAGPGLGEAVSTLLIAPSPVSRVQRLSDEFVNARFALALAIAGLVGFWRFHANRKVFGSGGIDYVEAFALGVATDAVVSKLPELLSKAAGG